MEEAFHDSEAGEFGETTFVDELFSNKQTPQPDAETFVDAFFKGDLKPEETEKSRPQPSVHF